jgi:hypothetical protein
MKDHAVQPQLACVDDNASQQSTKEQPCPIRLWHFVLYDRA